MRHLAALLAATITLTACGGGTDEPTEASAKAAYNAWSKAWHDNPKAVCDGMSDEYRREFMRDAVGDHGDCSDTVKAYMSTAKTMGLISEPATAKSAEIDGDVATITTNLESGSGTDTTTMRLRDGRWQVES